MLCMQPSQKSLDWFFFICHEFILNLIKSSVGIKLGLNCEGKILRCLHFQMMYLISCVLQRDSFKQILGSKSELNFLWSFGSEGNNNLGTKRIKNEEKCKEKENGCLCHKFCMDLPAAIYEKIKSDLLPTLANCTWIFFQRSLLKSLFVWTETLSWL